MRKRDMFSNAWVRAHDISLYLGKHNPFIPYISL